MAQSLGFGDPAVAISLDRPLATAGDSGAPVPAGGSAATSSPQHRTVRSPLPHAHKD
jgi:hypothetical protein